MMGMESDEVHTHSAFLAELLNPHGSHGLKDKCLKAFCRYIDLPFEFAYDSVNVDVEVPIGEVLSDYSEGGRIDILVKDDQNHAIIIENKIYAPDQPRQLVRYQNYARQKFKEKDYKLLYLTLDGHEASKDSTDDGNVVYQPISYCGIVMEWLTECVQIAAQFPLIRGTIIQYYYNLQQLLHIMDINDNNQLIEILAHPENIESGIAIANLINEAKKKYLENVAREISEKCEVEIHSVKLDGIAFNYKGLLIYFGNYGGGLYYSVKTLKDLDGKGESFVKIFINEPEKWNSFGYTKTKLNWADVYSKDFGFDFCKETKEIIKEINKHELYKYISL